MTRRYWITMAGCIALAVVCTAAVVATRPTTAFPPIVLDALANSVPPGHYMVMDVYDASGRRTSHYLVDPAGKRAVRKRSFEEVLGDDIIIYDSSGHSTFVALGPEIVEGAANYEQVEKTIDSLAGMKATSVSEGKVDAITTKRVQVDLENEGATATVFVDIDTDTGLRIREQWTSGSNRRTIVRGLVPATTQFAAQLERGSLDTLVQTTVDERMQTITELPYDVLALKPGAFDLQLLFITPGPDWDWMSFTYESPNNPGLPALVVETWSLAARTDYPESLLLPLSQAVAEKNDVGVRLCYRVGNTGVQIAAYAGRFADPVTDVAANLIDASSWVRADK